MPGNEEDKLSDLLHELRDLQTVLDPESEDAIPVLSDVVEIPQTVDAPIATQGEAGDAALSDAENDNDNSIPVLSSVTAEASAISDSVDSAATEISPDPVALATEQTKPAPFSLVDSDACDYDSSAAESLIEAGLNESLQTLTTQLDDEALRVIDELVAEHTEQIRQQLKLRLAAKSEELRADRGVEPS